MLQKYGWMLLFTTGSLLVQAQEFRSGTPEGYVIAQVKEDHRSGLVHTDREYHWVRARQLVVTQGGLGGTPLHGPFVAYRDNGQLLERGNFQLGLKEGEWRKWGVAGELVAVDHWRNGLLHGLILRYSAENDLPEELRYRRGKLLSKRIKLSKAERIEARTEKRATKKAKATVKKKTKAEKDPSKAKASDKVKEPKEKRFKKEQPREPEPKAP